MPELPPLHAVEMVWRSCGRWVLLVVVVAVSGRAYGVAGGKAVLASAVGATTGAVILLLQRRAGPPGESAEQ